MKIACRNLNLDIKAPLSKSVYHRELIINFLLGARGEFLNESGNLAYQFQRFCLIIFVAGVVAIFVIFAPSLPRSDESVILHHPKDVVDC